MHGNYWKEVLRVWDAQHGFWFVHAYVILTAIAPLINPIFDREKSKEDVIKVVAPALSVIFCWGALLNYNHLKPFVPAPAGLEPGCFFTFVGVYIIGRLMRVYGVFERLCVLKISILFLLFFTLISLTRGLFSSGNNPICVGLAVTSFLLAKKIRIPSSWNVPLIFISSFMFPIYCIHGTVYFPFTEGGSFAVIEWTKRMLEGIGFSLPLTIMLSAVIAFLIAFILALPYRCIEIGIKNLFGKVKC